MWEWIKFSLRVFAAYWTGWIIVTLGLTAIAVLVLAALVAVKALLH